MKTILWFCSSNRKTPAVRITMDEGKRKKRKTQRGGMARKRAVPSVSFSRRAHLLTTSEMRRILEAVVSLPLVGPCALRGGRGGISFSAENDGRCGLRSSRPRRCRCCHGQRIPESPGCCGAMRRPTPAFAKSATGRFCKSTGWRASPVMAADLSGHSAKRIFETIMADVVTGHYKNGRRR